MIINDSPTPAIDSEPVEGSENLITSGAVYEAISGNDGGTQELVDTTFSETVPSMTYHGYISNKTTYVIGSAALSGDAAISFVNGKELVYVPDFGGKKLNSALGTLSRYMWYSQDTDIFSEIVGQKVIFAGNIDDDTPYWIRVASAEGDEYYNAVLIPLIFKKIKNMPCARGGTRKYVRGTNGTDVYVSEVTILTSLNQYEIQPIVPTSYYSSAPAATIVVLSETSRTNPFEGAAINIQFNTDIKNIPKFVEEGIHSQIPLVTSASL